LSLLKIALAFFLTVVTACTIAGALPLEPIDAFERGDKVDLPPMDTLSGGKVDLSDPAGKTTVVAFWLHTCGECVDQIAELEDFLSRDGRSKIIRMVTVTRGSNDLERDFLESAVERAGIESPVALDPDLEAARHFRVTEVPAYVVVDKEGRVVTDPLHTIDKKIRDMALTDFIDAAAAGKPMPDIQFLPYTDVEYLREKIGTPAPVFALDSITGREYNLAEYRGKMNVLVFFWHPYCSFCVTDYKKLADYYRENRKKYNFVLLSIASIYGPAQMDEAKKLLDEAGGVFPILDDADSAVGEMYGIRHVPTMLIVNEEGIIVEAHEGEIRNASKRLTPVFDFMVE